MLAMLKKTLPVDRLPACTLQGIKNPAVTTREIKSRVQHPPLPGHGPALLTSQTTSFYHAHRESKSLRPSPLHLNARPPSRPASSDAKAWADLNPPHSPQASSSVTPTDISRFQAILTSTNPSHVSARMGNDQASTMKPSCDASSAGGASAIPRSPSSAAGKLLLAPSGPDDENLLAPYTQDWTHKWKAPQCPAVLQPRTTEQVAGLLRHCYERDLHVVPQGGNTGLVGGGIPLANEVILSLANMNQIISFDAASGILVCEAGCVLEELDAWLRPHGYIMPLDLGAKGSCQIGGNVSTNAGGLRFLRYGSLHGSVLGLEVVLADGRVLDMLSTLRKDNTGLDLKQIFIGAEGTLGVITKVSLQVPPAPAAVQVALVGLESFEKVREMVMLSKRKLGEILSAMELVDAAAMDVVVGKAAWGLRNPLAGGSGANPPFPFYMLLETSGSGEAHDREKMEELLEAALEGGVVGDGTVAQDLAQAQEIWKLRELIPVAMEEEGRVHKFDVSLPLSAFYALVERTREALEEGGVVMGEGGGVRVVGYGHLGDSNLHLNVSVPREAPDPPEVSRVVSRVLPWVMEHKGSVSAEHGLGQLKKTYLLQTKSKEVVDVMRGMKKMLDPKGILNPGKFFPDDA